MLTDDSTDPRSVPTRVNILDAMHWLVSGAQTHDALFFHCTYTPSPRASFLFVPTLILVLCC